MHRLFLMSQAVLMWLVFAASSVVSVPAQAAVICSFSGSGTSGTDCRGQTWNLANGGWGIPGIGFGVVPWPGPETASDFHWTCLTGCGGPIQNGPGDDTRMQVSPFGAADFWSETVSGGGLTIDFVADNVSEYLTPGKQFFTNITIPIDPSTFTFEASWTDDRLVVPEPSSLALIALALLGLGFARRQSTSA